MLKDFDIEITKDAILISSFKQRSNKEVQEYYKNILNEQILSYDKPAIKAQYSFQDYCLIINYYFIIKNKDNYCNSLISESYFITDNNVEANEIVLELIRGLKEDLKRRVKRDILSQYYQIPNAIDIDFIIKDCREYLKIDDIYKDLYEIVNKILLTKVLY